MTDDLIQQKEENKTYKIHLDGLVRVDVYAKIPVDSKARGILHEIYVYMFDLHKLNRNLLEYSMTILVSLV